MHQPKWVIELKEKASRKRLISVFACVGIAFIVILIAGVLDASYGESFNAETGLLAGAISLGALWLFMIPFAFLAVKVKIRRYNGYIICIYSGFFKEWLYIEGDLFDEGVAIASLDLYGQLPTGEEVIAKTDFWGDIKIYIGTTANNQSINLL